jgi:DNA-binding PadR family transcriptional regulator
VRALDGPIGHGSIVAALARLEQLRLVEADQTGHGRRAYRLTREVVHE